MHVHYTVRTAVSSYRLSTMAILSSLSDYPDMQLACLFFWIQALFQVRIPFPHNVTKESQLSLFGCFKKFSVPAFCSTHSLVFFQSRLISKSVADLLYERHKVNPHLVSSKSNSPSHKWQWAQLRLSTI